ncbi:MAG: hypothetical protein LUC92_02690 [Clostridiales bacterium]|nr:hypothetical protein [Clostridiales bacterium]
MEQKEAAVFRMKRNIKDTVFTRLFREKKYLLQLYQALHPEDTDTTEEDLKTITLEPIFFKLTSLHCRYHLL